MDVSKKFHRRPLIEADPDGLQKRETSMFFSCFCLAVDNLRELKKKKKKVSNSPTEREKKTTNGSVAPSNPDCRVVHHDGEKPHLQRGRGVDSARPPLTPGHFNKSDIEINYRLGSDFRPITAPVA